MEVRIKSGDTLSAVARRHGVSVEALVHENAIADPDRLSVGQVLRVPTIGPDAVTISPEARPVPRPRPAPAASVTVRPGDSLTRIAQRHGTTVEALVRLNRLADPDHLRVGQTLLVAPGEAVPAGPAPAAVPADVRLSAKEVEALTRAVAAEARGESPEVWIAVAQTIINYAARNDASITRLVRTSYLSSNLDGNRRYYTMPTSRIENFAAMREAVYEAARGKSPIGDRIHFHDTSIRTPGYGDLKSRVQIGSMVFYHPKG